MVPTVSRDHRAQGHQDPAPRRRRGGHGRLQGQLRRGGDAPGAGEVNEGPDEGEGLAMGRVPWWSKRGDETEGC